MPEGPEIWRAADSLERALAGHKVKETYFAFEELEEYESRINGASVDRVEARGKAIVTFFSNELVLYTHNQLYGKWMIRDTGDEPDTNRTLRVVIKNEHNTAFLYSASEIEVWSEDAIDQQPYLKKIGPDVLHPKTKPEDILGRYRDDAFRNRKVSSLLLDQGFISGIGNYLRSEILFYAQVDPFVKLKRYSDEEVRNLAGATVEITQRSYKNEGCTNDPEIIEALKREGVDRDGYRHFVYKRTGKRCYKCGTVIKEKKKGGRKIYFCPECQK